MHLLEPSDSAICQTLTLTTLYERIMYLVQHKLFVCVCVCVCIYIYMFESRLIPTLCFILGWFYQPERLQAEMYLLLYTLLASLPLLVGILFVYSSLGCLCLCLCLFLLCENNSLIGGLFYVFFTFMVPCITNLIFVSFQRDAAVSSLYFISLHNLSTYFGYSLRPLTGVLKTAYATTGTSHVMWQVSSVIG
jgi:hypothetical protein